MASQRIVTRSFLLSAPLQPEVAYALSFLMEEPSGGGLLNGPEEQLLVVLSENFQCLHVFDPTKPQCAATY